VQAVLSGQTYFTVALIAHQLRCIWRQLLFGVIFRAYKLIRIQGDKESIASIIKDDPFYQQSVADYKITQFEAVKCSHLLEGVMKSQNTAD
jgi:hypothetical protein